METLRLEAEFEKYFGRLPEVAARAPGRVNLIGEHTDYNQGLVLPCAIDLETRLLAAGRRDGRLRVFSRERGETASFALGQLERRGHWVDYVQGVVFALREAGYRPSGADLALASSLPQEAGLSSSAALAVGVATALDLCAGLGLDAATRARLAHRGESEFVGVGCGLMDHFASALGRDGFALRIDCRSQVVSPVALPAARLALLVAHSGRTRALAVRGYRQRVDECRAALAAARACGVLGAEAASLRDLDVAALAALERGIEPRLFRRARHVVRENARVEAACRALARGDLETTGALMREGMRSLRDDFEVSTPELDALCEIADAHPAVYGSRLTGAGFGGCTLHLVRPEAAAEVVEALARAFARRFGRRPGLWRVTPGAGAGALPLTSRG